MGEKPGHQGLGSVYEDRVISIDASRVKHISLHTSLIRYDLRLSADSQHRGSRPALLLYGQRKRTKGGERNLRDILDHSISSLLLG